MVDVDYGGLGSLTATSRFDVGVVEPDARLRLRMVGQLPGAWQLESVQELVQQFRPNRPLVAVFGPGLANAFGFQQINRIASTYPEIGAVIAVEELSTDLLQQALRAGVRDTVDLKASGDALAVTVARVGELIVAGSRPPALVSGPATHGRLIVVFSPKGGTGKSTIAVNTAVVMARMSSDPVVLVDADLQFGDIAVLLGILPQHSIVDALSAMQYSDPELLRSLLLRHESGMFVLPAPPEPELGSELRPDELVGICGALQEICGHVVVDCPTRFDDGVFALLDAADEVVLVGSMDVPSVKSLKVGMQVLNLDAIAGSKLRLVMNRANARVKLDVREVEQLLGIRAEFPIPLDVAVPVAANLGKPVVTHDPKSPVARALDVLGQSLMQPGVPLSGGASKAARRGRRR